MAKIIIKPLTEAPENNPDADTVWLYVNDAGQLVVHDEEGTITQLVGASDASLIARVVVADQAARFALTSDDVQNGDYVFQNDTSVLYEVTNEDALGGASGFTALATIAWTAITGKPTTLSGYGITDAKSKGWTLQTGAFAAAAGGRYLCNTTSAAFAATLPASPSDGDEIEFMDAAGTWDTNNLTLNRNGKTISGSATNLVCNVEGDSVTLVYVATANNWVVAP